MSDKVNETIQDGALNRQQLGVRLVREIQAEQAGLEEIHMSPHDPSDSIIELIDSCDSQQREVMWTAIQAYAEKYARNVVILNAVGSEHAVVTKDMVSPSESVASSLDQSEPSGDVTDPVKLVGSIVLTVFFAAIVFLLVTTTIPLIFAAIPVIYNL